jgi:hypothetical protein
LSSSKERIEQPRDTGGTWIDWHTDSGEVISLQLSPEPRVRPAPARVFGTLEARIAERQVWRSERERIVPLEELLVAPEGVLA